MLSCFDLTGKIALVTGGSRGIGRAIASALAQSGAKLAILARTPEHLKKACEELQATGAECIWRAADISDEKAVIRAVEEITRHYGRIDILINNAAAGGAFTDTVDLALEQWNNTMEQNATGMFLMAREAAKHMIRQKSGKIVFISSIATRVFGTHCDPNVYEISKGAVDVMIRALAVSWAKYGINVNGIAPGYTMTDIVREQIKSYPEGKYVQMCSLVPIGRFAEPEEIAMMAVVLSSDAASYMQGEIVTIDGGRSLL